MSTPEHEVTPKGQAFAHYYFIDRGKESDLSLEQALKEFEAFIYGPIRLDVAQEMVTRTVEEAVDLHIPEGKTIADLGEEDLEKVSHSIGLGFLSAYVDIHKPEDA